MAISVLQTEGRRTVLVPFRFDCNGTSDPTRYSSGPISSVAWSATGKWLVTLRSRYQSIRGVLATYHPNSAPTQHSEVVPYGVVDGPAAANTIYLALFINGSLSDGATSAEGARVFIGGNIVVENLPDSGGV